MTFLQIKDDAVTRDRTGSQIVAGLLHGMEYTCIVNEITGILHYIFHNK